VFDYPNEPGLNRDPAAAPLGADGARSYEELYVEHATAARRLALSLVPADMAEDIVAEAFARVLAAVKAGGGPSSTFRGYLLTAVRNLAIDWQRTRRRLTVVADMDVADMDVQVGHPAAAQGRVSPGMSSAAETQVAARDEARLVARAFGRLPARWRAVLWQLEVEGKAPAAVAPMFGLSANGVSALAMRAREGLRQAYLEEHVGTNIPVACRTYAAEFGAGARGRLSQRRRAAMQEHLGNCPACQNLFTELTELNSRLGAILTPAALAAAIVGTRSGRRAMMIRTGLNGSWRSWRPHPVPAVATAAAGVAVAGGMLFAVNVTPVTSSPSHATMQAAVPAATTSGPTARRRAASGGGGGGGGASLAGTGARAAGGSPGGASLPLGSSASTLPTSSAVGGGVGSPPGSAVAGVTTAAGTTVSGLTTAARTTVSGLTGATGSTVAGVTTAAGTAVSGLTTAAGATVSGLTTAAGTTVSGVTGAAGNAVAAVTTAAGTTVSGLTTAAGTAISGVTGAAGAAATDVTSTAGAAVAGTGKAVSVLGSTAVGTATGVASTVPGIASTAGGTVAATVGTASNVTGAATAAADNGVSRAATTAAAATTNAASTVAASATDTASSVAASATDTASSVATSGADVASTAATATISVARSAPAIDSGSTVAPAATKEVRTVSAGSAGTPTTTGLTSAAAAALQS
jgi:RNA polymerase sigma factor (sigma-70 family)